MRKVLLTQLQEAASEFREMVDRVTPAASTLSEKRRQRDPAWSRLFVSPIHLTDGTILFTLKDAAQRMHAPRALQRSESLMRLCVAGI